MKRLILSVCIVFALISCTDTKPKSEVGPGTQEEGFSIALIPTTECLPLYYASEKGWDKAQKFPLDIHSYMSQREASAALADSMDAGFACRESAEQMISSGKYKRGLLLSGGWTLLSSPGSRIRKVSDMADKVVAIAPGTLTESLAKGTTAKAGLGGEAVMYPHVISYATASSMLCFNQIDATVLPEPFATFALSKKAASLETLATEDTGLILLKDKRKSKYSEKTVNEKLKMLYNMAVDSLAVANEESVKRLIQSACKLSTDDLHVRKIKFKKAK